MKLLILQEKLKNGLNKTERIPSKSFTLPMLNNILLQAVGNFLNLVATDLENAVSWWSLAKIEKEGKIAMPAQTISSLVTLLPNEKVLLDEKKENLHIECKNFDTTLRGVNAEEFPILPKMPQEPIVSVSSHILCESISQIVEIPTTSTVRPEISGVYFCLAKEGLTMVATDSFRLGEKRVNIGNYTQENPTSFIVPQKAAKEIINIFGETKENIKIYHSPSQVMFESQMKEVAHPEVQFFSRIIDGEYPNYQEIMPKSHDCQIVLSKTDFLKQIKLAAVFSNKINEVKIKADPKKKEITLYSQNAEKGESKSTLPAKVEGQEVEVSFNYRFLIDGIAGIKSSEIIIELNGNGGPGVIKPVGDQSYIYLVMPIKGE